jgi:hypothetical protein
MMKIKSGKQRGAVLVVALVMLSMVTFLVVAFVGFARFERASVTASLVRTESGYALEVGLIKAQREVVGLLANNINHGLMVSQNQEGNATEEVPGDLAALELFATNLKDDLPRPPVFIHRSGDENATFPYYLDLNAAGYQETGANGAGDPHWIGLLENPGQPHGPDNRFAARYASMTVPAHKALNIRYNHNDLKRGFLNSPDLYGRDQGSHPRELNLAAPLGVLDPINIPYRAYDPRANFASQPIGTLTGPSAFGYAAALNQFGFQIGDSMHLSRPSKVYSDLLSQPLNLNSPLHKLRDWLKNEGPAISAPPYSYYQFMGSFSSTPLQPEPEKFNVNAIRDEIVQLTPDPGFGSNGIDLDRDVVRFMMAHNLKSGDKVEPALGSLPFIYDPINFDLVTAAAGATDAVALRNLALTGVVETTVPHRLINGDEVKFQPVGDTKMMPLVKKGTDAQGNPVYWPLELVSIMVTGEKTLQLQINKTFLNTVVGWGVQNSTTKRWYPSYPSPDPPVIGGELPPLFNDVGYHLSYRNGNVLLDIIPYFVKVIDKKTVSLHRSAELDEMSKVNFTGAPVGCRFFKDTLAEAMERMAGMMLNESLDTTGDGMAAVHRLGNQPLPKQEDPDDPGNPQPFPLEMGIGGHTEPLGPWHHPKKGIPWGRGSGSPHLKGSGRYTREMERIMQVSANITDLYSGYRGTNLPITGSEMLFCESKGALQQLPFGKAARDQSVSARITQYVGGYCGMMLCGTFEVRCVITPNQAYVELRVPDAGKPDGKMVARSGNIPMATMGAATGAFVEYQLHAECEGGRRVRVTLDGREILDYEHSSSEPFYGQAALLVKAPRAVVFTDLKPGVMPADADLDADWTYLPRPAGNTLPTTWRGVFRRDENNDIYLTGFQRWQKYTVGRNQDPTTSWYQRNAPVVIGVKDRSTPVSPGSPVLTGPGQNLPPAFTEFSLRTVYDRETKALYGRLTAEVHSTGKYQGPFRSRLQAVIKDAAYALVYKNKDGDEKVVPIYTLPNVAFTSGPGVVFKSPGYANTVMFPRPNHMLPTPADPKQRFAGLNNPKLSRFARLTDQGIELSGKEKNSDTLTGYSLKDIVVDKMTIAVEGEVHLAGGDQRTLDYINDDLTLSVPVHFANVKEDLESLPPGDLQAQRDQPDFSFNEWAYRPDYDSRGGSKRVIKNNALYSYKRKNGVLNWWRNESVEMRKLDISWQVKDPLVNSHGSDYTDKDYVPGGHLMRRLGDGPGVRDLTKPQVLRRWVPRKGVFLPLTSFPATGEAIYPPQLGVNLGINSSLIPFARSLPWMADRKIDGPWVNGKDSAIQDPNVRSRTDWRFPDISRGRIENVGWLGQVHRGTPWQTLYLKSRVPGLIDNITAVNNGVVTAPSHNLREYDEVQLVGKCPKEWRLLNFAVDGGVDAAGNIKEGQLKGFAEVLNDNQFRVWPDTDKSNWVPGSDIIPIENVAVAEELSAQNIRQWLDWAGSRDTMPANDRRLLEVFSAGNGAPVRGRFSVNNDSNASWSAALCGLSVPSYVTGKRILGANDPADNPGREDKNRNTFNGRIDVKDDKWWKIVKGINAVRGEKAFTRVTDILAAPELSDNSPYLPYVWTYTRGIPGFKDELDLERIPMQLMSLLRVDEQPVYVTYIFTEKLRPAFQVNVQGESLPAKGENGTILNYEVAGQAARRVIYKLSNAKAWHRSIKNNHRGQWRNESGKLQPLPSMRPIILHSSTLRVN